jgi:REP element-mobilizing transposase RayT
MKLHPARKAMRLPGYDYSLPGAYFVTACTKNRELLFETPDTKLAVESAWRSLLDIFADIELAEFVVMPNHIHCILCIIREGAYRLHPGTWKNDNTSRVRQLPIPTPQDRKFETLSNIIGAFKTTAATNINTLRGAIGTPVWQKSFHDRIIRNEHELERIQKYIQNNPFRWEEDRDNPFGSRFCLPAASIDDYWNEIFDFLL